MYFDIHKRVENEPKNGRIDNFYDNHHDFNNMQFYQFVTMSCLQKKMENHQILSNIHNDRSFVAHSTTCMYIQQYFTYINI